jgi:hypothetical protein
MLARHRAPTITHPFPSPNNHKILGQIKSINTAKSYNKQNGPPPGNIFVLEDGRIELIVFGRGKQIAGNGDT